MFSSRLNWGAPENPLAKLLQRKRSLGDPILDLTESNPTAAGFTYPASLLAALADPRSLRYEPHPAGLASARAAVANYYGTVSPARVLLTASTSEGYAYLFKLLADPGDEVLVPRPSYPLFEFLAELDSVRAVQYPLTYEGRWWIDFDALRNSITPRTRALVLVNPNNPTGSFLKRSELNQLIAVCAEHRLAIISDEVFSDYVLSGGQCVRSLSEIQDVLSFVLSGFSKVLGLPQLKFGWILCGGPDAARKQALERLELIADTYLSVGTPVQWAADRLLGWRKDIQKHILDRVHANREVLSRKIGSASPWRLLETEGGWYAVLEAPKIQSEEEWALGLLRDDNVLVQPGFFFDFEKEAYLVVSLLTRPEVFCHGVERILARAG
ncbi:MAG TPA: pyridoxal phosphate-dependent aminotransferase [Bryobacteraceae bacterium]|nr:pyridoxal phosphate-dependent aminotransferase [Bryobacteraceae bacterium]